MKVKSKKASRYVFIILCTMILSGCFSKYIDTDKKGETDKSVQELNTEVKTIKEGLPFANERVEKWQEGLNLEFINVKFENEEQIINKQGIISYFFYGENIEDGINASAEVDIDMSTNSIVNFTSTYGTSKELLGGGEELYIEKWQLDIEDAIDIAIKEIGEDKILSHEKPNIIIRCWENVWQVAELSNEELPSNDYLVEIDPETGQTLSVEDKTSDIGDNTN